MKISVTNHGDNGSDRCKDCPASNLYRWLEVLRFVLPHEHRELIVSSFSASDVNLGVENRWPLVPSYQLCCPWMATQAVSWSMRPCHGSVNSLGTNSTSVNADSLETWSMSGHLLICEARPKTMVVYSTLHILSSIYVCTWRLGSNIGPVPYLSVALIDFMASKRSAMEKKVLSGGHAACQDSKPRVLG